MSTLINLKPIESIKNLGKANDEGSSHLWFICYMSGMRIAISNIKSSLLINFF